MVCLFQNTPNVTLEIANRIYLEQSRALKTEYKKTISEVHQSDVQSADFINNAEKERTTVNGWVSKKTHDKINNLLPPGINRIFYLHVVLQLLQSISNIYWHVCLNLL